MRFIFIFIFEFIIKPILSFCILLIWSSHCCSVVVSSTLLFPLSPVSICCSLCRLITLLLHLLSYPYCCPLCHQIHPSIVVSLIHTVVPSIICSDLSFPLSSDLHCCSLCHLYYSTVLFSLSSDHKVAPSVILSLRCSFCYQIHPYPFPLSSDLICGPSVTDPHYCSLSHLFRFFVPCDIWSTLLSLCHLITLLFPLSSDPYYYPSAIWLHCCSLCHLITLLFPL